MSVKSPQSYPLRDELLSDQLLGTGRLLELIERERDQGQGQHVSSRVLQVKKVHFLIEPYLHNPEPPLGCLQS